MVLTETIKLIFITFFEKFFILLKITIIIKTKTLNPWECHVKIFSNILELPTYEFVDTNDIFCDKYLQNTKKNPFAK